MASVKFNKDTVQLSKDVRDNVTNIDFHVPGGAAIAPRANPRLDGRSTECYVSYRDKKSMPTEIFKVTQGQDFPDYVQITVRGPDMDNGKHVVKANAMGGNNDSYDATWTRQDEL